MSRSRYNRETGEWDVIEPGITRKPPGRGPDVMPDIAGFFEPGASDKIPGRFIDGRADLRNYERSTGKRQIGDQIGPAPTVGD